MNNIANTHLLNPKSKLFYTQNPNRLTKIPKCQNLRNSEEEREERDNTSGITHAEELEASEGSIWKRKAIDGL